MTTHAHTITLDLTTLRPTSEVPVQRGMILPVKHGESVRARCGECRLLITLTDATITAHQELVRRHWKYTRASGYVCARCAPLPRLSPTDPNRIWTSS